MKSYLISMAIGAAAGFIDIVPMIAQKLEKRAIVSAFLHYFLVSIVIVNINLPGIVWWLQGSVIAFALTLPIIVIISGKEQKAIPIVAAMSVILGACIGLAGHYFK
jgi:hypothetical protein